MSVGREKKIKILFAIGNLDVGGAQKLLVHQLPVVDRARFVPTLITIFPEKKDSFADRIGIGRCFDFKSTFDLRTLLKLVGYLRRERFDVVVTHLFTANLLARAAAILAGVPVIISYEHNIYPNKRPWQIIADKLLSFWTARIITDSEAAARCSSGQAKIPLRKFTPLFIPPLFDLRQPKDAALLRKELEVPDDARVILTVSRLVSDKGHVHLINAAAKILERHHDAYFLIVGWGPLKESLEAQAKALGIDARIKLPGRMDIQDVLPLGEIYVEPAVSTDLPVAIMEAMREGKPIVATRIGEIPLFVQHERTGLIVEPHDESGMAESIERMLDDSDLRDRLGAAARRKVGEYSIGGYEKQFEEIILGHLAEKKAQAPRLVNDTQV